MRENHPLESVNHFFISSPASRAILLALSLLNFSQISVWIVFVFFERNIQSQLSDLHRNIPVGLEMHLNAALLFIEKGNMVEMVCVEICI